MLSTLPRALGYASSLLRDRTLADDVVHDCYLRLLQKADVYDLLRDGTKLLYKAITNACIDRNHRERVRAEPQRGRHRERVRALRSSTREQAGPLQIVIQKELEDAVEEGMAQLPVAQRAALELKSLGYSMQEIAEALGTSPSNAGVLVHRARKALAEWLASFMGSTSDEPKSRIHPMKRSRHWSARAWSGARNGSTRVPCSNASRPPGQRLPPVARNKRRSDDGDHRRRFLAASWAWGLSAAAAVLLMMTAWLFRPGLVLASPESLVREAKQAHRLPLDRCYLVEVRKDSAVYDECFPMTSQVRLTRLWTRGDRFWVESVSPERRWDWGRDERNHVWFAFEPHRAVRLEPGEVPRWLNLCCDLYCIRLEQLLGTVLRDFDLERETPDDDSGGPHPRPRWSAPS